MSMATCVVPPFVMASSLSKVSPPQAQRLLHHVAQFKALRSRLGHDSSCHLARCFSDTGECSAILQWKQAAWLLHMCFYAASHQPSPAAHRALERSSLGRIDVIFGPMFAGKSSELLRRVTALEVLRAAYEDLWAVQAVAATTAADAGCWQKDCNGQI